MLKENKKYLINILLISLFGGGAIYFSVGKDLNNSIATLSNANPIWISVSIIMMFLYYFFDSAILYFFGKIYNKNYKYLQAIKNSLSGLFFNGITPFSSGGQFVQVYIFNKQGILPVNSTSILLMAFIVYQTVLVCFTAVVLFFKFATYKEVYSGFLSFAMIGFLVNVSVIVILFLGAKSKIFQTFFCDNIIKIGYKFKIVKNLEATKENVNKKMNDFRSELQQLQSNKNILIKAIILNFFKLFIIYSIPFFVAKALNFEVGFMEIFDYISLCSVVYLITSFVPIPGASGGSEGVFGLMFSKVLGTYTAASMLLWRFITYYMGLIIGALVFATDKETK